MAGPGPRTRNVHHAWKWRRNHGQASGDGGRRPAKRVSEHEVYERIAGEADFIELRRRYRRFAFPATVGVHGLVHHLHRLQQLGPRLHGHPGCRQHQRRAGLRPAAVRLHVLDRLPLRPATRPRTSIRWPPSCGGVRERRPADERPAAGPAGHREPLPHHRPVPRPSSPLTLGITFWASRQNKTTTDYYAGGRSFSGFQNGLAIGGDYMSAASFLGISGSIALYGYDGFLYSIGFLVAWLVALLLVAELLRNSGRYTMADQLAYRMRQTPVRTAAATSTIVVSIFYLLAQMVGAGAWSACCSGSPARGSRTLVIVGCRRADDHLRHPRRDEGHDLGADRQGGAADDRQPVDHGPGAGRVRLQPVRAARRSGREVGQGRRRSWSRACSTARTWSARSTSCPSGWPWCWAPPACRTS